MGKREREEREASSLTSSRVPCGASFSEASRRVGKKGRKRKKDVRFLFKKGQAVAMVTQQRRRGRWSRRRDDMRLLHPRALALALVVLALATPRPHLPLSPAAAQENGTGTTVSSDVMDDENDDGTFSSALECEIELEYSASAINMPKFDATFAIRNNRGSELSAWQVVWRYASEKLIPGSVEGE